MTEIISATEKESITSSLETEQAKQLQAITASYQQLNKY